jgi:ubiquinol-cytochrome c reductase cytochrome c1 subunit
MKFVHAVLIAAALSASPALANSGAHEPEQINWAFDGVFGKFDKPAVQRGLQVYKEVCSACHGLKRVPFRRLQDIGLSEAEVKAFAGEYTITDGPNDEGEMFDRPGRPSDHFPSPYANEKAARAMQNGAYPPDLSLIIKAREDGANYVHAILTGYSDAPEGVEIPEGGHYNKYFPGGVIKMPPPLADDQVSYQDPATKATMDQEARDVVNFLQWAAEPEMEMRKRMGIKVIIFLSIMTGFFYVAKKRIWSNLEH